MSTQIDIEKLIKSAGIQNELEFERALITERKLRILAKENPKYKSLRKKLRDLIEEYEKKNWSETSTITEKKLKDSDYAEFIAELERKFIEKRGNLIREKIKSFSLTQQELGIILGHRSKSYISELINGIYPFTLKDLIIIHRIFKIDLADLIPTILPQSERKKIKTSIEKLDNPKLKLSVDDLMKV